MFGESVISSSTWWKQGLTGSLVLVLGIPRLDSPWTSGDSPVFASQCAVGVLGLQSYPAGMKASL